MPEKWERNIWTGDDLLRVTPNGRIVRNGGLYSAEFWGDYSLDYPKKGPWRGHLGKARADLAKLASAPR